MKRILSITLLVIATGSISSCSTSGEKTPSSSITSSAPTAFNKNSVKIGQRYTWQGTIKGKDQVLVATEEDRSGNAVEYIAELRSVTLPSEGTKIIFDGVLQDASITGTDFRYRPDGSRTTTTTRYLVLKDCHIH